MGKTWRRNASWKGKKYHPTKERRLKSNAGQRNRYIDDKTARGELFTMPRSKLDAMVKQCRAKKAYNTRKEAYHARNTVSRVNDVDLYIYECPFCGKWHMTGHPWIGHSEQ